MSAGSYTYNWDGPGWTDNCEHLEEINWSNKDEVEYFCKNYTDDTGIMMNDVCYSWDGSIRETRDMRPGRCQGMASCNKDACASNGVCTPKVEKCNLAMSFKNDNEALCDSLQEQADKEKDKGEVQIFYHEGNCYTYADVDSFDYVYENTTPMLYSFYECGQACMINGKCPTQAEAVEGCLLGAPQWPLALFTIGALLVLVYRFLNGCRFKQMKQLKKLDQDVYGAQQRQQVQVNMQNQQMM